jgi:D-alanyl-D-alanine carboxypeptidase
VNGIEGILNGFIEKERTPSVQYSFFDRERVICNSHQGFADIGNQVKCDENTLYNGYSVTKTFTALAVLQLAEKELIDIDKPAITYLPGFPYPGEITVRHLLSHTAGIPNPIPLGWIHLVEDHDAFHRNSFFSRVFDKHSKPTSKPNEKYSYSNLGYVLLGAIIEYVSGTPFEDFIREEIIDKLHLKPGELGFIISGPLMHAKGYHKRMSLSNALLGLFIDKKRFMNQVEGKWQVFNDFYVNGVSYGGLIGTAGAFARYLTELLKPGSVLISDEYKKMLFTENLTNSGMPTGMCLSWFKGELDGRTFYSHAGGGGGFYCEIRIYPEDGLGSVIMFNRTGMKDERVLNQIDRFMLKG